MELEEQEVQVEQEDLRSLNRSVDGFSLTFRHKKGLGVFACDNNKVYWSRPDFSKSMEKVAQEIEGGTEWQEKLKVD